MEIQQPKKKMSPKLEALIRAGIIWALCDTAYRIVTFICLAVPRLVILVLWRRDDTNFV